MDIIYDTYMDYHFRLYNLKHDIDHLEKVTLKFMLNPLQSDLID
jgi:hypothetical protein